MFTVCVSWKSLVMETARWMEFTFKTIFFISLCSLSPLLGLISIDNCECLFSSEQFLTSYTDLQSTTSKLGEKLLNRWSVLWVLSDEQRQPSMWLCFMVIINPCSSWSYSFARMISAWKLSAHISLRVSFPSCSFFFLLQLKDCRSMYESYVPMIYKRYYKRMGKYVAQTYSFLIRLLSYTLFVWESSVSHS